MLFLPLYLEPYFITFSYSFKGITYRKNSGHVIGIIHYKIEHRWLESQGLRFKGKMAYTSVIANPICIRVAEGFQGLRGKRVSYLLNPSYLSCKQVSWAYTQCAMIEIKRLRAGQGLHPLKTVF
ncbi:MAG TPA: hypothetical protein DCZ94_21060 [Lentisphaeria bacterium]|nr:MAG: hypothetical protein A2X48_23265 [Lentisphaerae bacterium GWF2_49_21]HBC89435.1 hypothetical protein [Lentisphaeria bacterium]